MMGGISRRISLFMAVLLVVSTGLMLFFFLNYEENQKISRSENDVINMNQTILRLVEFTMDNGVTDLQPLENDISKSNNVESFKVLPTDLIRPNSESAFNNDERRVLNSQKQNKFNTDNNGKKLFSVITPVIASNSCITCHDAKKGDVLALVRLDYDMTTTYKGISDTRILAIFVLLGFGIVIFVVFYLWFKKFIVKDLNLILSIVNRISKGNLKFDDIHQISRKDEIGELYENISNMSNTILDLTSNVKQITSAAALGKLNYRIDESEFSGEYADIMHSLNQSLASFSNIMNSASNLMIADFDGNINFINQPVTNLLTTYEEAFKKNYPGFAVNKLVGANIDMFHKSPDYNRDLLKNLGNKPHTAVIKFGNEIFRLVINTLNGADGKRLGYVVQWNNISNQAKFDENLRSIIEQITVGNLSSRFDEQSYQDSYRDLAGSLNMMIDGIVNPLNVTSDYLDKISNGIIPNKINDLYLGDFNKIKNSLNRSIDSLSGLIEEINKMSLQHDLGDLDIIINSDRFKGAFKQVADGVNNMVNGHISVNKKALNCFEEFGKGNLDASIEVFPGKKVFINTTIEKVRSNIKELISDALLLAKAAENGNLDFRADLNKHDGDFKAIISGFNQTLDNIIGPLNMAAENIARISKGDMPQLISEVYNGDFNEIKNNINSLINSLNIVTKIAINISDGNLEDEIQRRSDSDLLMISLQTMKASINTLISDVNSLANSAQSGILDNRANESNHKGEFRSIIEGINRMFDTIVEPINESIGVLELLADGDLTTSMKGNYQGDLFKLKKALNDSIESINDVISQVKVTVEEVSSGSIQVSDASTALSQGATEQAASLEEITSSMTEIGSQTKTNAENANQANILTNQAKLSAEKGANEMGQLNRAMHEISESSRSISKIIKVIDEIAFQTNLLALNAAVEAARAGRHGKGFAVVAEEVRNLAARSATAAKETSDMIEKSIKLVENGSSLANKTSDALEEIKLGNIKAADIVGEIATASDEQAQGIAQINEGLVQIDKVTQTNTASAEESASASEQLSGQANMLKNMISKFIVKDDGNSFRSGYNSVSSARMIEHHHSSQKRLSSNYQPEHNYSNPRVEDIIKLDEDDFGRY